jgi:hypothetical protein
MLKALLALQSLFPAFCEHLPSPTHVFEDRSVLWGECSFSQHPTFFRVVAVL